MILIVFHPHDQSAFLLCKIPSTNFNSDSSNVLTIQIDFYFPKLYFSLLKPKLEFCHNFLSHDL